MALETGAPATRCLLAPVWEAGEWLSEAEALQVRNAVGKRRNEYATGRWLARRALDTLGVGVEDLLSGTGREPLWPRGVRGSIAHTDSLAVVLVSNSPLVDGLGIDLEQCGRLQRELVPRILTPQERSTLDEVDPTLLFSAKEAVYKLLYPLVRSYVDFHEVEVSLVPQAQTFAVNYVGSRFELPMLAAVKGYYQKVDNCWLTWVALQTSTS